MKKLLLLCMLIAACLLTVPCVYAQDDFPDDPGETDTGVPFDGGTSLLIIASIAYGIKNGFDEKTRKKNQTEQ